MIKKILVFILLLLTVSCKKQVQSQVEAYHNDFESGDLANFKQASLSRYNGSSVLGLYNAGGFELQLNDLPKHDLVTVTFDLYIHGSWDGNMTAPDGPDLWEMLVDGDTYISTTFSNVACGAGVFCSPQSYPDYYPNNNHNPKSGAARTDLPGMCQSANVTTLYRIEKTFSHSANTLSLKCFDKLVQSTTVNAGCDESWSVDNISIKAIAL